MLGRVLLLPIVIALAAFAVGCDGSSSKSSGPAIKTYPVETVETPKASTARHCNGPASATRARPP